MIEPSKRTLKIISAGALVLTLVWQHVKATRLGYAVENARHQAHNLRANIGAVRMDLETSVSPARLAVEAKTRLGMYPAPPESMRILDGAAAPARDAGFLARLMPKIWRG